MTLFVFSTEPSNIRLLVAAVATIAISSSSHAQDVAHNPVSRIYAPYVTALEQEIELSSLYQTDNEASLDNISHQNLSVGTAVNSRVFAEIGISGSRLPDTSFRLDGYEIETRIQLTEQGEYSSDWGLLLEIEHDRGEGATEVAAKLLASRQWGDWVGTVNLGAAYEFGSSTKHGQGKNDLQTSFSAQWRYRYRQQFEPSLEFYADEYTQALGPALSGIIRGEGIRKWHWEAGVIFGLKDNAPDNTYRFLLEYEF